MKVRLPKQKLSRFTSVLSLITLATITFGQGCGSFSGLSANFSSLRSGLRTSTERGQIWEVNNGTIDIQASSRDGGAIFSLNYNGKEFINSPDHGREFQMAFDQYNAGECNNPTEDGSADDFESNTSTSVILSANVRGNVLTTSSHPAYWLKPGETSSFCSNTKNANTTDVDTSQIFSKTVTVGFNNDPHVIKYDGVVTNSAPIFGVSGGAGAFLNPEFTQLSVYVPSAGRVYDAAITSCPQDDPAVPNSYGCLQAYPTIMSTDDGNFAMGVISGDEFNITARYYTILYQGDVAGNGASYDTHPTTAGANTFTNYYIVGTKAQVAARMKNIFGLVKASIAATTFDQSLYAMANGLANDPITVGSDWLSRGSSSGLRASALYDNSYYPSANGDLAGAGITTARALLNHYVQHGLDEGRRASLEFDAKFYLTQNPDVAASVGGDYRAAALHWQMTGIDEGRAGSADFDAKSYLARYSDLQAAFGATGYRQALYHWITAGRAEGRNGSPAAAATTTVTTTNVPTSSALASSPSAASSAASDAAAQAAAAQAAVDIAVHPIYRLRYKLDHLYSGSPTEGTPTYTLEGAVFSLYNNPASDRQILYRCLSTGAGHFLSLDPNCEGAQTDGGIGYVSSAQSSLSPNAIYRCIGKGGYHLETLSQSECAASSMTVEGPIGWVH